MSAVNIVKDGNISEKAKIILIGLIESWGGISDVEYEQSFTELVSYIAKLEKQMSKTQWISVNERLPETAYSTLVLMASQGQRTGFYALKWYLHAPDGVPVEPPSPVTHWMDLPEPPAPPKPADPFEAWWEPNKGRLAFHTTIARSAWNAAKAHYERPLPDFEAWCKKQGRVGIYVAIRLAMEIHMVSDDVARSIWNAAQGKQDG